MRRGPLTWPTWALDVLVLMTVCTDLHMVEAAVGSRCQTHIDAGIRWTVNCSWIGLHSIPPPLSLHPIITLDLSHNSLETLVESSFIHWADIQHLDLSHNNICQVNSDSFNGLEALTELNLMNNCLEVLSSNITNYLPKLRVLNLSTNKIKVIMPETFQPVPLLLRLLLRDNCIGNVSTNFNVLNTTLAESLIHLDIANTCTSKLPENMIENAQYLISLNLAQNELTVFPSLPQSLRYLNMSHTLIETIPPDVFSNCQLLQRLILEDMPFLKELGQDSFYGLTHLEELYVKRCPFLSIISPALFGETQPKLRRVSLAQCSLTTLPSTLRPLLARVDHLDLQRNPWHCNYTIAWLAAFNISTNLQNDLRCEQPAASRGMLLVDYFKPKSHPYSSVIRTGIIVAMVVILLASVVAMIKHSSKEKNRTYQSIRLQEQSQTTTT